MEEIRSLKDVIEANAEMMERALESYSDMKDEDIQVLFDAESYSLLGGGKRIRPLLVNEFCRLFGGEVEASLPLACAIEYIHTYSLIHDDLPCMDDDDLRRGRPANHKQFGYATALLAGDALLTKAFSIIAESDALSAEQKCEAVKILSRAAGECGMIGGQIMDLDGETKQLEFEKLLKLHSLKTGALMECSARLGCVAAGCFSGDERTEAAANYARKLGVAFQVIDDVLDECEDESNLGKNIGSDMEHNKTTFLTYFDEEGARKYAEGLTCEAITAISSFKGSAFLTDLAVYLLDRKN